MSLSQVHDCRDNYLLIGQLHGTLVVAVIAVGMAQPSIYQVIDVLSVRHGFVSTAGAMLVRTSRVRRAVLAEW